MHESPSKTAGGGLFRASLMAVVGSVIAIAGTVKTRDAIKLKFGEQGSALAEVAGLDQPIRRGNTVKYRFKVDGSSGWYTRRGVFRGEASARVSKDAWEQARSTGTIAVIYNKSDPWLNIPVAAAPIEGWPVRAIATAAFGGVALLGWTDLRKSLRARRRPHTQNPDV